MKKYKKLKLNSLTPPVQGCGDRQDAFSSYTFVRSLTEGIFHIEKPHLLMLDKKAIAAGVAGGAEANGKSTFACLSKIL